MPAHVQVILGPAISGKTTRLLGRFRRALAELPPLSTVWLAPTQRAAYELRGRLLTPELDACFSPGVMTFDQFAGAVVNSATSVVRPMTAAMKRHLIRRLVEAAHADGRLTYFGPIAHTPGLVDLLGHWIAELKRLEIWPDEFREACRARGMTPKDRELAELYEQYQLALTEHELFDAEGRFWSARALLREGQTRPFDRLRLVVVDGFADFTRTQHEILEILAERVEELFITLPLELDSPRPELFAKPQRTLEILNQRHPSLVVETTCRAVHGRTGTGVPPVEHRRDAGATGAIGLACEDSPQGWPALAHLQRELFKSPREVRAADDARGMKVLAAPRLAGEIELVGQRIKELLTRGGPESGGLPVRPGDVAVIFRSMTEVAPLVREVFSRLGLPFALETGQTLNDSPAMAALVALLRLELDDWPFRQLLAVLGNNYFQPAWEEWSPRVAMAAEQTIRELQLPSGRKALLARAEWLASPPDDEHERAIARDPERQVWIERRRAAAELALPALRRLARTYDRLPHSASAGKWVEALTELAEETGFLRAIDGGRQEDSRAQDRVAWERLCTALAAGDELSVQLGQPPPLLELRELVELLLDMLRFEQLPGDYDAPGRVRVLSAAGARNLSIPYLFFAGLSEKAMPAPDREDRLYSDAEYERLHEKGLPVVLRAHRHQDEMLLFYDVVTRATRYLHFSYPALDEKAQPLLASPFLAEVERAMGERLERQFAHDLSPIPQTTEPQSPMDVRLLAVAEALEGDCGLLAGLIGRPHAPHEEDRAAGGLSMRTAEPPAASRADRSSRSEMPGLADNLLAGLRITAERAQRQGFGPFEGILPGKAIVAKMADRFGPDHLWSASELEQYARCPFHFYLQRVLRLEPPKDIGLEPDYRSRGWRLHASMAALHRKINAQQERHSSPCCLEEPVYRPQFEEVLSTLLALDRDDGSLERALREIDHRLLTTWLTEYHRQHAAYDANWAEFDTPLLPAYFEVSFGMPLNLADGETDQISREEPLSFVQDGETIKLAGRIDRIDLGQLGRQPVFNVVDYKSGRAWSANKANQFDGTLLQLEVYAIAAEEVLLKDHRAVPLEGGYWFIQETGYRRWLRLYDRAEGLLQPSEDWQARRQQVIEKIFELARGIRAGQFPVYSLDADCTGRCDFSTVCRINHIRSLEKQWPAPPAEMA
jgi:ATP-dependent helicase/DNAse subunit B